jgi:hypothetical protein
MSPSGRSWGGDLVAAAVFLFLILLLFVESGEDVESAHGAPLLTADAKLARSPGHKARVEVIRPD